MLYEVITIKQFADANELAQFAVTVVNGGKGGRIGDVLPDPSQVGPAILTGGLLGGVTQEFDQGGIATQFVARFFVVPGRILLGFAAFGRGKQVFGVDELRAGIDKGRRCFLFRNNFV